ncbi:XdhC family protein [Pseudomonas aeruginosa]|nr:XdhC family protein [Pseudomonas aeruginosa]
MPGTNELLDVLLAERNAGRDVVLATVVKVDGSAYRRPGARMLISRFGKSKGSISGGCLEAEAAKRAWWLTETGPTLRSYTTGVDDMSDEEELSFGLGCNGTVYVLFERLSSNGASDLVNTLVQVRKTQFPAAFATVIASKNSSQFAVGDRLLLAPGLTAKGRLLETALAEQISRDLRLTLERCKSNLCCYVIDESEVEVFLEYVPPMQRLVVFGGGHDAQPLVRMAKMLGWYVSVIDGRANFARPERFPEADCVLVGDIEHPFAFGELVRGAAVAVMTHSFVQDLHWLQGALQSEASYVGQLGPRERTGRLLAKVRERLGDVPGLQRLHYPIGLDLGGDTPEIVAIAILGEITATLNGRSGGSLRHRAADIHEISPVFFGSLEEMTTRS